MSSGFGHIAVHLNVVAATTTATAATTAATATGHAKHFRQKKPTL